MSSLSSSVATSSTVLKESSAQNVPKPQSPSEDSLPRSGQEPLKYASPLAEHTICKSQGEFRSEPTQENLDDAASCMFIDPQLLLIKPPDAPRSAEPKKRTREEDTVVGPVTLKRGRARRHQAAAGDMLDCPWPGCQTRGIAVALWDHLQHNHAQVGKYPRPEDYVQCGWDGCTVSGTSGVVVGHFEKKHKIAHNGGTHVNENREKKNIEGASSSAGPQDERLVCKMADCGVEVQNSRSFRRHVYGKHWHHADYYSWCGFCGRWKRRDQNCEWRAHQEKCIRDHLEDYGPQPTTVDNVGAWW